MIYTLVLSSGPTLQQRGCLLWPPASLHPHQASIRTLRSPEERTRCTLVFKRGWGCILPDGLCDGRGRQFQATVRSPQNRMRQESRKAKAALGPRRPPFFRFVLTDGLSGGGDRSGGSQTQRLVEFTPHPAPMQQQRQFACHPDHPPPLGALARPPLGVLATSTRQLQPPAPQVTVRAQGTQNILGAPHQQTPQQPVAGFGDAQFRVLSSRLVSPRSQPQKTPHRTAASKTLRIFQ